MPGEPWPVVLWDMLSSPGNSECISWTPQGDGFIIHSIKNWDEKVRPKYYAGSRDAFQRSVNKYGFTRRTGGRHVDSVEYFMGEQNAGLFDRASRSKAFRMKTTQRWDQRSDTAPHPAAESLSSLSEGGSALPPTFGQRGPPESAPGASSRAPAPPRPPRSEEEEGQEDDVEPAGHDIREEEGAEDEDVTDPAVALMVPGLCPQVSAAPMNLPVMSAGRGLGAVLPRLYDNAPSSSGGASTLEGSHGGVNGAAAAAPLASSRVGSGAATPGALVANTVPPALSGGGFSAATVTAGRSGGGPSLSRVGAAPPRLAGGKRRASLTTPLPSPNPAMDGAGGHEEEEEVEEEEDVGQGEEAGKAGSHAHGPPRKLRRTASSDKDVHVEGGVEEDMPDCSPLAFAKAAVAEATARDARAPPR